MLFRSAFDLRLSFCVFQPTAGAVFRELHTDKVLTMAVGTPGTSL